MSVEDTSDRLIRGNPERAQRVRTDPQLTHEHLKGRRYRLALPAAPPGTDRAATAPLDPENDDPSRQ